MTKLYARLFSNPASSVLRLFAFTLLLLSLHTANAQAPTNNCGTTAGARLIPAGACGSGSISDATLTGIPAPTCGVVQRDGWFWFNATATSHTVTATVTNRQLLLQVFSGTCGALTQIGCSNATPGGGAQTETVALTGLTIGNTYFVRICNEADNAMNLTSVCVTNTVAAPCNSITTIAACGSGNAVTANTSTAGVWSPGTCGFTTPGLERIYRFTPAVSGIYSITVTSVTGGYLDYFWVASTDGCSAGASWTCIDDIGTTGSYGAMNWTAGVTYFLLLDDESNAATSHTFYIGCPLAPPVTASNCNQAINVCTNLDFTIDPNGIGIDEIPALGTVGNPDLGFDGINSAWGTDHEGCLRDGETNSTWMIVNVAATGTLEFVFGGGGTQAGYYDWIMYPYTSTSCTQIPGGTVAPVRCNWNYANYGGTGIVSTIPAGGEANNFEPALAVTAGQRYVICFSNWSSSTTSVPLLFTGTGTVSCTPLGVELATFEGHRAGQASALQWETFSESGTAYFNVLHSTDGIQFTTVGTVEASATTGGNYRYTHYNPAAGLNYYKLVSAGNNNAASESAVVTIDFAADVFEVGNIFPNPTGTGQASINIYADNAAALTICITDLAGRVVHTRTVSLTSGKNTFDLSSTPLPKGLYTISLYDGHALTHKTQKLVVN